MNSYNLSLVELNWRMAYSSKTFKIRPIYKMMYHSCIDVLRGQKSPLTEALLEKEIGTKKLIELQQFEFDELIEKMIYDLKKELKNHSYDEVKYRIQTHERFSEFMNEFNNHMISNNLTILSFRIPPVISQEVKSMKVNTLGEVIEVAISLFLTTMDDKAYELTLLAYKQAFKQV